MRAIEQTVYADLYFIINFAMDFLCFFLVSRLLSIKERLWRVLAASAFGGVYACAALFLPSGSFLGLLADILACIAMCAIAYIRRGDASSLFSYSIVYAAISIVLGGFMTALFTLFNRIGLDRMLGSEADADGISVWIFGLLALAGGIASAFGTRFFKKKSSRYFCRVRLCDNGRTLEIKGMCDSGNLLCDPISARPCIMIELSRAKRFLRERTYKAIERGRVDRADAADISKIRIIPVNTVSGSDMMYALRLPSIEVDFGEGYRQVDALAVFSVHNINADGASALVPSSLNFGSKKNNLHIKEFL